MAWHTYTTPLACLRAKRLAGVQLLNQLGAHAEAGADSVPFLGLGNSTSDAIHNKSLSEEIQRETYMWTASVYEFRH